MDLLVANDVAEPGSGFGTDTNRVELLAADGSRDDLPLLAKRAVADRILDRVAAALDARDAAAQTVTPTVAQPGASMSASTDTPRRLTVVDIAKLYADGARIPMLTAYDYPTARILDEAGIPLILVGDSRRPGDARATRRPCASRWPRWSTTRRPSCAARSAPWSSPTCRSCRTASPEEAIENAGIFMREAGAQAVKVEGGVRSARIIETLVRAGIPVMGHIGLTPQAINTFGKVKVQGKSREQARALIADAQAVQEAGAFSMVLELVPTQLAAAITERLHVPTIGIGAGRRLQRPGPGHHRPHRPRRLHPAPRPAVRPGRAGDPRGGRGLRRRRRRRARSRARRSPP